MDVICVSGQSFQMLLRNQMKQRIYDKNKNFKGNIKTLNLKTAQANIELAKTFGVSNAYYANNPDAHSDYNKAFRLKCDTDTDYDEEKAYELLHPSDDEAISA